MGRKIPAKRHRGVKNPLEQQARREKSLKCKINAPPKDPDEQPVPRSLSRLFAFQHNKQDSKQNKKINNKRKKVMKVDRRQSENPVAALRRLPGESGREFSLRITGAARALAAAVPPAACPEEFEADDVKGERMAARRERKRRCAAAAARNGAAPQHETLTRSQKIALKKKAIKEKADDLRALEHREVQHDRVAFGDVVHGPPSLRGVVAARPGRRPLLLTALLARPGPAAPPLTRPST